jgi:predicted RND superfamily exporter protein
MRREENATAEDAVRYAFSTVGKPLWVTSFILVAGFSIMVLSPMAYCDNMGILTSLIIIFALIGNLFYLPSLLIIIEGQQEEEYATAKEVNNEETIIAFES